MRIVSILLLVLISLAVYQNSLQNDFVWDDVRFILDHNFIKNWSNIKYIFSPDYLFNPQKMLSLGMYNVARPVWVISAMIDYKIWGANPFGHHLTNIILHSLVVVLLFIWLNLIFKDTRLSFLSSLIFTVHPIHTENINVVSFRIDILALLFMLFAFIAFVQALDTSRLKGILWVISSVLFYLIALFAKEMAVTLPLLLGVYLYLFVPGEKLRRNKRVIIFYFSLISFLFIVYLFVHKTHFFYGQMDTPVALSEKSLLYRMGVWALVFRRYLGILFFPVGLCADYSLSFLRSIFSLQVFLSGVLLAGIFIYALMVRRKRGILTFAILWFLITLLPVSNLIPIVNIIAERYLYIPSVGFSLLLAFAFIKLSDFWNKAYQKKALSLLIIFILCFYVFQTARRNRDWRDNLTIWTKTVRQSPDNFRARNNLGRAYRIKGRFQEAIEEFKQAIEINPKDFIAHANLAVCYNRVGKSEGAKLEYQRALEIRPAESIVTERLWILNVGLGNDYLKAGRFDEAMEEYLNAIQLNPQFAPVHYNLGNIFLEKGLLKEAQDMYLKAIEIDNNYAEAHCNLGVTFAKEEKLDRAKEEWTKALQIKPDLNSARENLERVK